MKTDPSSSPGRPWRTIALVVVRVALVGAAYAALNLLAARFRAVAGVSMLYPASAVGVAAALVWRWEAALAVALGTLVTPWTGDNPPSVMAAFAVGNMVEVLVPALVLKPRSRGSDVAGVARVVLWACVVNTLLNAVISIGPQVVAGLKPLSSIAGWWLADAMAVAVFGLPFILALRPELFFATPEMVSWGFLRSWRKVLLVVGLTVLVSMVVFFYDVTFSQSFNWPVLLYLLPLTVLLKSGGLAAVACSNALIAAAYLVTLGVESSYLGVLTPVSYTHLRAHET